MSNYQCQKCGKISSDKSKVCDPVDNSFSTLYVCESCNKQSVRAEEVCKPQEVTPSYFCGKCGTSGSKKSGLCDPHAIQV
jgi:DNA-directed RNA polymerase subunit RPC12/RpoP